MLTKLRQKTYGELFGETFFTCEKFPQSLRFAPVGAGQMSAERSAPLQKHACKRKKPWELCSQTLTSFLKKA